MRTTKTPELAIVLGLCLALGCGGDAEETSASTNADDDDSGDDDSNDDNDDGNDDNDDSASVSVTDSSSDGGSVDSGDTGTTAVDTGDTGDTTATTVVDESTGDPTGESSESSTGEQPGDTIYEIQDGTIAEGAPVEIYSVIVTAVRTDSIFVQEPAGGEYSAVLVYSNPDEAGPDLSDVVVGDSVDFSGVTAEYFDHTQVEITTGTFVNNGADGELSPELLPVATFADEVTGEPWESVLVRVEGDFTVTAISGFDEITVVDGADETIIDDFVYSATESGDFADLGLGASFTAIQGPLNFSFMNFKIAPRSADDLEGYQAP